MHHPERWIFDWFYKRHDMDKADNRFYRQTETERRAAELHEGCQMPMEQAQELAASEMSEGRKALLAAFGAASAAREQGLRGQYPKAAIVLAEEVFSLRAALRQKHAEYEDMKRCAANNASNLVLRLEAARRELAKVNNEFGSENADWPEAWRRVAEVKERAGRLWRDNETLRAALTVVVRDWTEQFERNGHLAPAWVKQAREALGPNV